MKRNIIAASVKLSDLENKMDNIRSINKKKESDAQDAKNGAIDGIFDQLEGLPTEVAFNVLTGVLMSSIDTLPADSQKQVKSQLVELLSPKVYNH